MDRTDALFILTALSLLAIFVNVFGPAAALTITGLWLVWLIIAGMVAGADTYKKGNE